MAKVTKNSQIVSLIEKELKNRTSKDISENEVQAFAALQEGARKFLRIVQEQIQVIEHQDVIKEMQETKNVFSLLYGGMRSSSNITQQILLAQHDFEKVLNTFLNREIYLTFVTEDGSILVQDDVATGKIYQQATANAGRGNISIDAALNYQSIDQKVKDINAEIQKEVRRKQLVYQTAISRWNENQDNTKQTYKKFYWIKNNTRRGWSQKIDNQGRIAEAYAQAVIARRDNKDISNTNIEGSLEILSQYYIGRDNIPAALKGDITVEGSNIQYAIKANRASTARVGQYIKLAYNIGRINKTVLQRDFYIALPRLISLSNTANKIVDLLNNESGAAVDSIIQSALGGTKVNSIAWNYVTNIINKT